MPLVRWVQRNRPLHSKSRLWQRAHESLPAKRGITAKARQAERLSPGTVCEEADLQLQNRTRRDSRTLPAKTRRVNAPPPRKRCKSVRFTPTAAINIVVSISDTRRSRANSPGA